MKNLENTAYREEADGSEVCGAAGDGSEPDGAMAANAPNLAAIEAAALTFSSSPLMTGGGPEGGGGTEGGAKGL
jgi:hypothetical protein